MSNQIRAQQTSSAIHEINTNFTKTRRVLHAACDGPAIRVNL
jgi:hypothetical protein